LKIGSSPDPINTKNQNFFATRMTVRSQRIVIFADVHMGRCKQRPDGSTYGDPTALFQLGVDRAVELEPQRVVLLGDVVNRGFPQEYECAKTLLAPLQAKIEPVVGNHELQRASLSDFESAWSVRASRETTICGLPTIILNSGIEGLPDERWNGQLDEASLRLLSDSVTRHRDRPLLILCHFPMAGTVRRSELPMSGLENSPAVSEVLSDHRGPLVFISGHTHMQSVLRRDRVTYVGCPALGFWPHAFVVMDIAQDCSVVHFTTIQLLDDPAQSPDIDAMDPHYRASSEGTPDDREGVIRLV
jgi:predicted phosphodiesterase